MKQTITTIFAILILIGAGLFTIKSYESAKSYEEISNIIVKNHNVTQLSTNQLKKLAEVLSLGFYNGYDEILQEQKRLLETQTFFKQRAVKYTQYALGCAVALLLFYFVMTLQLFTVTISLAALISLFGGLFIPIMMMSIHTDVKYLGDVVLVMESKGVLGSISKLFGNGDYIVGGALLLFSIILPLFKTLSMLFVALFMHIKSVHSIVHFFKMLGKWSMADVFVVSMFLVYLSGSKGEMSRAEVQMGLYFFLMYVILSMIASFTSDKMLQENNRV